MWHSHRLLPSESGINTSTFEEYSPSDTEVEANDGKLPLPDNALVPAFIKRPLSEKEGDALVSLSSHKDLVDYLTSIVVYSEPRFILDVTQSKVIQYTSELLTNLDLMVNYYDYFKYNRKEISFEESLVRSKVQQLRLRQLLLKQDGYFSSESNYFFVTKGVIPERYSLVVFRNARVSLTWRGLHLTDMEIKKIISYGFAYLIGAIDKSEFVFHIRETIPSGKYEINIVSEVKRFVAISIEEPIFPW